MPEEAVSLVMDGSAMAMPSPADLHDIMITRYVNAAAYVILLYDHLLSLGSESKLIWPAKLTSAKAMFLFIRYMVPIAITIYTVQLSGLSNLHLDNTFCRGWMSVAAFMGWATVAISNFLILLRLWVIWDRDRKLMIYTLLCFIIAQIGGLAAASLVVFEMQSAIVWNSELGMCGFAHKIPFAIVWAPGTVFEIILCGITWWNALDQPRSSNAPLAAAIYRDGFVYFLLLLVLRITNTVLAFTAPRGLIFIAMFPVWCATTTTTCRLVIKLRHIVQEQIEPDSGVLPDDLDMSVAAHGDYDELVQSGVHIEILRSVRPSTPVRMSKWH
ncbi:hypothetical protein C8R44DRAFT_763638 [Mycena epipterygia]|nr:hypothetical protein C8R44DRAFT_763638 [Mycena epipterygia]